MYNNSNAIQNLLYANEQWAQTVIENNSKFFHDSTAGQKPKILWIGCSDSRVPESVITASKPGDLFVHRNVANQFHLHDESALAVLAYAIEPVGVQHVVLVGHTHCGGAAACLGAAESSEPQPNTPLTRWLAPLTAHVKSLDLEACSPSEALNKVVEANVIMQVDNICRSDPITTAWANANRVTVHGWVYDLGVGRIKQLVSRDAPN